MQLQVEIGEQPNERYRLTVRIRGASRPAIVFIRETQELLAR